jgi:hypothetical protein
MFDHKHYLPILKGKEGEYAALSELAPKSKEKMTPLIEIPPIAWDFEAGAPEKTIDKHLEKVSDRIAGCWDINKHIFIDLLWIPESEVMSDGQHPLTYIFDNARMKTQSFIPVTGIRRGSNYQDAVKAIAAEDKRGVCLRLENNDFDEVWELDTKLPELLEALNIIPETADLILDFKEIPESQTSTVAVAIRSIISAIPDIEKWRSLTFAGTGFPSNLSDIEASSIGSIFRSEWSVWETLVKHRAKLKRLPTFGDYAINHPEPFERLELDPRLIRMSASLRYTADKEWLIVKGRNTKDHGREQYHGLCQLMIKRPEYKGTGCSWGDDYINGCAGRSTNPGNPTIWRKVGTNHHLTFVTEQIASLPGL